MALQTIGLGTSPNDGTGDSIRVAGDKINDNFVELYNLLGDGTTLGDATFTTLTTPTVTNSGTLALSATGANIITASTNGVERARIDSSGVPTFTQSVNSSVTYLTQTNNGTASGTGLKITAQSGAYVGKFDIAAAGALAQLGTETNHPFLLITNNVEAARFDSSGNFLIGTTTTGASKLVVADDSIQVNTAKTPASASATGTTGQIAWDASYIYVCTATNTWRRVAHGTW